MFGSSVGFSGFVDRMALFPVQPNPRWQPAAIGVGGLNGANI